MSTEEANVTGMAGRYATALFELAVQDGSVDAVAADLDKLSAALRESADLKRLVRSPVFSSEDQARAIVAVMSKLGVGKLTSNFVQLVARNRRLYSLDDMAGAFRQLVAHSKGEIAAEVTSAVALDDSQLATLRDTLKSAMGRDVQLATKVDPAILGGLIVKVGSRMIDSSIRTKLNNLKFAMKEAH